MFGYVIANTNQLTETQQRRYQAYYCGLCRTLGRRSGKRGRLTLSYDMTFLAMLLTGLYEPESREGNAKCIIHPTKKHDWIANSILDYAADMSIMLAYYNFLDDWQDDKSQSSRVAALALSSKQRVIAKRYPRQCAAVHHCLSQLGRYEKENCQDLDKVSGCFGELLATLFLYKNDIWSSTLQEMGYALGKFIYLMDAYEDWPRDKKKRHYNPLSGLAQAPDFEERCHEILTLLMAQCAQSFEKLPIIQDSDLLRNILYSGVWTRYNMIADKRKRSKKA